MWKDLLQRHYCFSASITYVEDESPYKHDKISILSSRGLHCESQYGGHYPDGVSCASKKAIGLLPAQYVLQVYYTDPFSWMS